MIFRDRVEAGRKLANRLEQYRNQIAVVYGLPRGGVVVAVEIAKTLNAPLDLVIVRKIGHPYNPEYAIGAVAEDGHMVCNETERGSIDQAWFNQEKDKQQKEAKRRREVYLGDRKSISAKDKIAILVDDGVATGLSLFCAINELKHQKPKKIVVAIPVSPPDTAEKIRQQVDELVSLEIPSYFLGAVGAYYQNFDQVEDKEVIGIIKKFPPHHQITDKG